MTNMQVLQQLRSKDLQYYGSWALYDMSQDAYDNNSFDKKNLPFDKFHSNLDNLITTDAMLLGLNCATRDTLKTGEWTNFHDTRSMSQDYKIPYIVKDTILEGAYMTDVFKDLLETDSTKVASKLKSHPEIYARSIELLQFELDTINPSIVVCFGNNAYDAFTKLVQSKLLSNSTESIKIVKFPHYSGAVSYDTLKSLVHDKL